MNTKPPPKKYAYRRKNVVMKGYQDYLVPYYHKFVSAGVVAKIKRNQSKVRKFGITP